jgi:hypothetical protein
MFELGTHDARATNWAADDGFVEHGPYLGRVGALEYFLPSQTCGQSPVESLGIVLGLSCSDDG